MIAAGGWSSGGSNVEVVVSVLVRLSADGVIAIAATRTT
jgi:hypothetical protein